MWECAIMTIDKSLHAVCTPVKSYTCALCVHVWDCVSQYFWQTCSTLVTLNFLTYTVTRVLCVTIILDLVLVLSVWSHSHIGCYFITGGMQRRIEVSTCQCILYDFCMLMCFIRAWYNALIVNTRNRGHEIHLCKVEKIRDS